RTLLPFSEDHPDIESGDAISLARAFGREITWSEVCEHRVAAILGEAGSGKTTEFRRQVEELRKAGRAAYFVTLNELRDAGFPDCLDLDDETQLRHMTSTGEEALFFLDALDEAKLHQGSLETILRKLRRGLGPQISCSRVFVSCRVSDWLAVTDHEALHAFGKKTGLVPASA